MKDGTIWVLVKVKISVDCNPSDTIKNKKKNTPNWSLLENDTKPILQKWVNQRKEPNVHSGFSTWTVPLGNWIIVWRGVYPDKMMAAEKWNQNGAIRIYEWYRIYECAIPSELIDPDSEDQQLQRTKNSGRSRHLLPPVKESNGTCHLAKGIKPESDQASGPRCWKHTAKAQAELHHERTSCYQHRGKLYRSNSPGPSTKKQTKNRYFFLNGGGC